MIENGNREKSYFSCHRPHFASSRNRRPSPGGHLAASHCPHWQPYLPARGFPKGISTCWDPETMSTILLLPLKLPGRDCFDEGAFFFLLASLSVFASSLHLVMLLVVSSTCPVMLMKT